MTRPVRSGNTILPPPRLSGDAEQDTRTIQRWVQDLYDGLAKAANVVGDQANLRQRVTVLEAQVAALMAGHTP